MNLSPILAHTSLHFHLTFTHSLISCQVFGVVAGEKFSVDIDNSAIDSTLDQFFFYFLLPTNIVLVIFPYFIYAVTWSRLHTCDCRKATSVHAKIKSQGITSIRS